MLPTYCHVYKLDERRFNVMLVEFTRLNKTYQCSVAVPVDQPPPARIEVPFRPCAIRPPYLLQLEWITTDELRGIELYKPAMEMRR